APIWARAGLAFSALALPGTVSVVATWAAMGATTIRRRRHPRPVACSMPLPSGKRRMDGQPEGIEGRRLVALVRVNLGDGPHPGQERVAANGAFCGDHHAIASRPASTRAALQALNG